jgi:hypothetical protein
MNLHIYSNALRMTSSIFWDTTPCGPLKVNRRFVRNEFLLELCYLPHAGFFLGYRSWRQRQHIPPKRRLNINGLHGVILKKIELSITTAVRTSNPTPYNNFNYENSTPITVARGLRHELSSLAWMLGSWVRFPLNACMFVCVYSVFVLFFV